MPALSPLTAHTVCLFLVAADLTARALRIKLLLAGVGERLPLGQAFLVNGFGDAACALTPYRFGGEPARMAGAVRAHIPFLAMVVAVGYEVSVVWPTVGVVALSLGWLYGGDWWHTAVPRLVQAARTYWPLVAFAVAISVVAAWAGGRGARVTRPLGCAARQARDYWRRMSWRAVAAAAPLTLLSLGARVALLPVLALSLPEPQPVGPTAFASFALLYSQLVLPTPAGSGAIELGFLGGAAGNAVGGSTALLVAWRAYSSGIDALLGIVLSLRVYGVAGLKQILTTVARRLRSGRPTAGCVRPA